MAKSSGSGGRGGRRRASGATLSRDEAKAQFTAFGDRVFSGTQIAGISDMATGDFFVSNYQLLRVDRISQNTIRAVNIRPNGTEGGTMTFQPTQNVRPVSRADANEIIRLSGIING